MEKLYFQMSLVSMLFLFFKKKGTPRVVFIKLNQN